ncbi:MAG: hypothetical protein ACK56K_11460, partial [Akkermansiaceae bacterium]
NFLQLHPQGLRKKPKQTTPQKDSVVINVVSHEPTTFMSRGASEDAYQDVVITNAIITFFILPKKKFYDSMSSSVNIHLDGL